MIIKTNTQPEERLGKKWFLTGSMKSGNLAAGGPSAKNLPYKEKEYVRTP